MILRMISIYCNHVHPLLGNAFLWPFSVPIHGSSHLKKQSRDPDVVGRVQNGICQARVSEKAPIHIHNRRVGPTIRAASRLLKENSNGRQTTND